MFPPNTNYKRIVDDYIARININLTMPELILANRCNVKELKKVIDKLGDLLLNDAPAADCPESKEVNEACDRIIKLMQNDYPFYETLKKVLHGFLASENLSNADNLKYILKKYRFYHHFLHTHSDADRIKHINILRQVLEEIEITEIPAEIDKSAAEKLRKKVFEKVALQKFNIHMTHTALMILSKYWPINDVDYATLEPIPPETLAFVRSGHHYDWQSIFEYSKIRRSEYPQGTIPETALFAYNTRETFDDIDAHHILRVSGTYPDSIAFDLLFRLYELQFLSRVNEIRNELYTAPGYRSTEIDDYRLSSINRQDEDRLINTAKKYNESVDFDGMQIAKNEFISRLRSLIANGLSLEQFASLPTEMQEAKIFPDPAPAIPQTHTSFLSTNHYRREHISEVIRTNFGDEALSKYFSIRPQITMQEYYVFLRQSQAMKQEIHTLLQERPNDDRLANDRLKLEAIEKLKNLLENPAVWQHEQLTKMTHIVVRNLIHLIKDEGQPSNNNRVAPQPY